MDRLSCLIAVLLLGAACGSSSSATTSSSGTSGLAGASTGQSLSAAGSSTGGSSGGPSGTTGGSRPTSSSGGNAGSTTGQADAGIVGLGMECDPGDAPDSCASFGLACDPVLFACELPGELAPCLASVGCSSASLVCSPGFEAGGTPESLCTYPCQKTADCPNLITSCQEIDAHGVCFVNRCATNGTGFFAACPSAASADGECLPFFAGFEQVGGACAGTGTLANGAACSGVRSDAGAAGLCLQGSNCATFDAGMGNAPASFCEPTCYSNSEVPNSNAPACATGDICFNFSDTDAYGSCYASCAGDAGQACAAGTACDSFLFFLTPFALCLP